jgi:hypothetical protein
MNEINTSGSRLIFAIDKLSQVALGLMSELAIANCDRRLQLRIAITDCNYSAINKSG